MKQEKSYQKLLKKHQKDLEVMRKRHQKEKGIVQKSQCLAIDKLVKSKNKASTSELVVDSVVKEVIKMQCV